MLRASRFASSVFAVSLLLATSACTKSHDVDAAGAPLSSDDDNGAAGSSSNAGSGASGTGDIGTGSAGTGTGTDPGPGCNDCQGQSVGGFLNLPGCCAVHDDGVFMACGLDVSSLGLGGGCLERDAPGEADTSCPSSTQMGFMLPGCCRPDGTCGSLDMFLGLGCAPNVEGVDQNCGPVVP